MLLLLSLVHRREQCCRLSLSLYPLPSRNRISHNSSTRLEVAETILSAECPDRYRKVSVPVSREITNSPRIGAPGHRLKLLDDLHRPDLGCARDSSRREDGPE